MASGLIAIPRQTPYQYQFAQPKDIKMTTTLPKTGTALAGLLTTELLVQAQFWKHRGREDFGYVEAQGKQYLLIKRWKWRGFTAWTRVMGTEEVPTYVWISSGALGFYDGPWKSKFAAYF